MTTPLSAHLLCVCVRLHVFTVLKLPSITRPGPFSKPHMHTHTKTPTHTHGTAAEFIKSKSVITDLATPVHTRTQIIFIYTRKGDKIKKKNTKYLSNMLATFQNSFSESCLMMCRDQTLSFASHISCKYSNWHVFRPFGNPEILTPNSQREQILPRNPVVLLQTLLLNLFNGEAESYASIKSLAESLHRVNFSACVELVCVLYCLVLLSIWYEHVQNLQTEIC